ncbi:tetratricopeptide repeat protein [Roseobacteraceae bacterium S113]
MRYVVALCAVLASPTFAETCPQGADHGAEIDALYAQMLVAENEPEAREYSNALWGYWTRAPDDAAQGLLDMGMSQRASYDLIGAIGSLTTLIEYCPDYAEGWNQRAFAKYLGGQFDQALPDLDRALEIRPRHLGALTGKALTLVALERKPEAILVLRKALALNPWLGERHMLPALEAGEHDI